MLALWLMEAAGGLWWLWLWIALCVLQLVLMWMVPVLIMPLFNKFTPLADEALRSRIEQLLTRCGFSSRGVFIMDGSKRSTHGNAFFAGFGRSRRVVFFDTLISTLEPEEIEAVLAHELGHFRRGHLFKSLLWRAAVSLALLAALGWLAGVPAFYTQLGVSTPSSHAALLLFAIAAPVFTFLLGPLASLFSRKHEYEADAFAAQQTNGAALARALVKLHRDNAKTLTPDPLYSAFYYSHPPAAERIGALEAAGA
jgi:STE24 endopeptidase